MTDGRPDDEPFPVVDVYDWPVVALEPGGTDEKVWLGVPGVNTRALFKPNRARVGSERGEDWPEKLASELATTLGIPAARIDLAERNGRRGCLSYDIVPTHEISLGLETKHPTSTQCARVLRASHGQIQCLTRR
jgi:hypothetical protein